MYVQQFSIAVKYGDGRLRISRGEDTLKFTSAQHDGEAFLHERRRVTAGVCSCAAAVNPGHLGPSPGGRPPEATEAPPVQQADAEEMQN